MSLTQEATGTANRIINFQPENYNRYKEKTTNVFTRQEAEEMFRQRTKFIILVTLLIISVILLIVMISILIKIGYIDNSLQNLQYKMDFT